MRYLIILIFFISFLPDGSAQPAIIRGSAPGAELKRIELTMPADLITFLEKQVAVSKVDSSGHFELSVDIPDVRLATISIDFHEAEIILEPAHTYEMNIEPMRYDDQAEINPFIKSQKLTCDLVNTPEDELNLVTGEFNAVYSAFLQENFNALYRDRNKTVLDSFRMTLNRQFGGIRNPWFMTYARYKFASLEQLTRYHNQAQLAKKYFAETPVMYHNVEYMDFFNSFFSKYLTSGSNILRKIDFRALLRKPGDTWPILMKAMVADTLVNAEQLRELVLLKGLMEMCNSAAEDQTDALAALRNAQRACKYPENRAIAANMVSVLTHLKPGSAAPGFTLPDKDQKPVKLAQFKGKPTLLSFWTTYCDQCLSEMDAMQPLVEQYGREINFISISADKYFTKMRYYLDMKPEYQWTFLHIDEHSELLKQYDVRNFPLYVLMDSDMNIYKFPADHPGSGLENDLQQISGK